jgi:sugar lactone lactonase YvrE
MSVMPLRFIAKYSPLFCLAVLSVAFCASSARAQAPAVVIDAQQVIGTGFNNPQSIAVSTNGTVYVADTTNNRIVALTPNPPLTGTYTVVSTYPYILVGPQALAIDANGDLFIGDTPTVGPPSQGRVIKLAGDGQGNPVGPTTLLYSGSVLSNPISLAVDSAGDLFIGDYPLSTGVGAIYKLAAGAPGTPASAGITGLSSELTPASLLAVGTNLYIADNGNGTPGSLGGVFIAPVAGGAATKLSTPGFTPETPSGLAEDTAGDLYILTVLSGAIYLPGQQVLVIPGSSPTTPYVLPNTALDTSTSMAFDPSGNLDVVALGAKSAGEVVQFAYVSPVNLGSIAIDQTGTQISYNFEFTKSFTFNGFEFLTQGDTSAEVVQATGGTCATGKHTTLPDHGPAISAVNPYICQNAFYGDPTFPGKRTSSIELKGAAGAKLGSTLVYETGLGGAEITYPLNATATAVNLEQPQAVVVSGLNDKVYVADFEAGVVYVTNGVAGSTLTQVSTKPITLSGPAALALDGAGNLYIGDFNLGEVIKVPIPTGGNATVVNTGGLVQHPIAITFDQPGNLYIGDAGSGGIFADFANPGYVVKVPVGGAPFKLTIPSVQVVFPQALAADPKNAVVWIGDGGDPSSVGQVVQVASNGSSASAFPVPDVTNPTGLGFDTADDLYVLDGTVNTITVVPPTSSGVAPHLVEFDNSLLAAASAMGTSAGAQSFIIANIGAGSSNSLVYINGNRSTLLFGDVKVETPSAVQTATEYNIGDSPITFNNPFYTTNPANKAFAVLPSSTCGAGVVLQPSQSCTINVQFTPTADGSTSQDITVQSNAYNPGAPSGAPILRVAGTGTGGGAIKPKK